MTPRTSLTTFFVLSLFAPVLLADSGRLGTQSRSYHTGNIDPNSAYRPEAHALVDLDNDGKPELVAAHQGNFTAGARISVQHNDGDGSFEAPVSYPAGGETMDVVGGDFDGDGWNDVAFARTSNSFSGSSVIVMHNDGTGALEPYVTYTVGRGPTSLVALDADGDGDLDLATANSYWGENDVTLLTNDGQAQFSIRTDFAITVVGNPWRIACGDVDGDGDVDLATTFRDGAPGIAILANDGLGHFTHAQTIPSPAQYIVAVPGLALGDADNDGDVDLVYASSGQGGYALFENGGSANFGPPSNLGGSLPSGFANDLEIADVTGDGWPDVIGVGYSDKYGFALVAGDGGGGFLAGKTLRAGEMSRSVSTGDLDGDGDREIVVTNHGSINVTVHRNELGQFELPPVTAVGFQANATAVGDLDQDGDLDAVTADTQIYRLINDGSGSLTSYPGGSSAGGLFLSPELALLDGDAYPDLIAIRSQLLVRLNAGDGTFQPATSINVGAGLKQAKAVDFDNDGRLDIVCAAQGGFGQPNLYAVRNLGNGQFAAAIPSTNTSITQASKLVVGDFTGDGFADVITGQGSSLGVWTGAGGGAFTLGSQPTLGNGGTSFLAAGDVDNDGDLDVVAASIAGPNGPSVTVLKNNGSGIFGAPNTMISLFSLQYSGCTGVALFDCDHDGDLDIAAGSWGGNGVSLFENTGVSFQPEARYGLAGAVSGITAGDFDGDGRGDVIANLATEPPIGGGVSVLFGRPYAAPYVLYCTAKANSLGCVPQLAASGAASATAPDGFSVVCTNVRNLRPGLLLNGITGRFDVPFLGGYLCVRAPRRSPGVGSGGNPLPANDCSGAYSIDLNAYGRGLLGGSPWPELSVPGTIVNLQWWGRDPGFPAPNSVALSGGLEAVVGP